MRPGGQTVSNYMGQVLLFLQATDLCASLLSCSPKSVDILDEDLGSSRPLLSAYDSAL